MLGGASHTKVDFKKYKITPPKFCFTKLRGASRRFMKKLWKKAAPFVMLALILLPTIALAQVDVYIDELAEPLGLGERDVRDTIASIINVALGLLGIVTVVIIIYAGFLWMTAGGDKEKITTARQWITGGIIGLIIILSAYAIARFVVSSLLEATS